MRQQSSYIRYFSGILTLFMVSILPHFLSAQETFNNEQVITFGANRMEIGEQFHFNAVGQFQFNLSYGMLDLYAQGVWEQKADTLFLTTTTEYKDYDVEIRKNPTIPKGKVALLFNFGGQYIRGQKYRLDSTSSMLDASEAEEVDSGYVRYLDFDKRYLYIELYHRIFHAAKPAFVVQAKLKRGYNEISIHFNKNIQLLNFTKEIFVIKGNKIVHQNPKNEQSLFADDYDTHETTENNFFVKETTRE